MSEFDEICVGPPPTRNGINICADLRENVTRRHDTRFSAESSRRAESSCGSREKNGSLNYWLRFSRWDNVVFHVTCSSIEIYLSLLVREQTDQRFESFVGFRARDSNRAIELYERFETERFDSLELERRESIVSNFRVKLFLHSRYAGAWLPALLPFLLLPEISPESNIRAPSIGSHR